MIKLMTAAIATAGSAVFLIGCGGSQSVQSGADRKTESLAVTEKASGEKETQVRY